MRLNPEYYIPALLVALAIAAVMFVYDVEAPQTARPLHTVAESANP